MIRVFGAGRLPEGESRAVLLEVEGEEAPREVLFARLGGTLYALDTYCPHEGGRIIPGPLVEDTYVQCPLHLYCFDPRTGAAVDIECPPARTYAVREVDGDAEVTIAGPPLGR